MNFGERKGGTAVWHTVLGSGLVGIYLFLKGTIDSLQRNL